MGNIANLQGLIPLLGGIYALLLVYGVLPRKPINPEGLEEWRRKKGGFIKVLSVIMVLFGIAQLLGFFV